MKSWSIYLKQTRNRNVKKRVKISDEVMTNFAPRALPGWALDYDVLKAIKPDIIMVTLPLLAVLAPIGIMSLMRLPLRQSAV